MSQKFRICHVGGVKERETILFVLLCSDYFAIYLNMPAFCLVLECSNDKSKPKDLSFCRLLKVIKNQGEEIEILSTERRQKWLSAISRQDLTDKILENDRVCGEHFHSGKDAPLWDKFNVDWVPSLNLGHQNPKVDEVSLRRRQEKATRVTERRKRTLERDAEKLLQRSYRG